MAVMKMEMEYTGISSLVSLTDITSGRGTVTELAQLVLNLVLVFLSVHQDHRLQQYLQTTQFLL